MIRAGVGSIGADLRCRRVAGGSPCPCNCFSQKKANTSLRGPRSQPSILAAISSKNKHAANPLLLLCWYRTHQRNAVAILLVPADRLSCFFPQIADFAINFKERSIPATHSVRPGDFLHLQNSLSNIISSRSIMAPREKQILHKLTVTRRVGPTALWPRC